MSEATTLAFPAYGELPRIDELGARHAWDVFPRGDQLGRLNLITAAEVERAADEVRTGERFNLSLPLNLPDPPFSSVRKLYAHHVFSSNRNIRDDYVDSFYFQNSTQWDSFRHVRAREFGFWQGSGDEILESDDLGISAWADHGIASRGVLIDVAAHLERQGDPLNVREDRRITVEMLEETLSAQGCVLRQGDVALIRTGFVDAYLDGDAALRKDFVERRDAPGLHGGEEMAEFLWDSGVAAVVADNVAVESIPGDPAIGSLHRRLIPLLGFPLGELFRLGPLAEACASDGRWTCMFVGVPLNLPGAAGSPGNALALR